ncbi:NHS-like protein 3 [Festucalex cinctus]
MSRRRSTGDLVPWDVSEIVGREAKAQRGHRKPGSSLGQAISWLRSSQKRKKKTKKSVDNGARLAVDGLQNQDAAKAGPKANDEQKKLAVHYSASQHFQENVFIEGNRPQYLEDLHSEAQEGLKILQQEGRREHESGVNFAEDESCASSDTAHPEEDLNSKDEGGSLESNSNSGTDTTRTSSMLTRPMLTRQGSTFKPLHPVKRLEKNRKRNRRTTIMGIPNQVQKELASHRDSTFQQVVSPQLPNHNSQSGVFIIPTVDGGTPVISKKGARVHLSELEQVFDEKQQMRSHHQEVYKNDTFNHQGLGTHHYRSSVIRPKSVAVPGMTTFTCSNPLMSSFLLEPQGPVMSVSPQATYLSTIIPNAVLPASVEVIEIDRGSQRGNSANHGGSAHTVSKSSLASVGSSASPFLSRKSDGDGSQTDSSFNNLTTQGTTHKVDLNLQESWVDSPGNQELTSLQTSVNHISKSENVAKNKDSEPVTACTSGDDVKIKRNSTRSLSIIKTKLPPAPPRRSNSLHNNKMRNIPKGQVEDKDSNISASQGVSNSTGSTATTEELKSGTVEISTILYPISNSAESNSHRLSPTQASSGEARKTGESVSEFNPLPQKNPSEGEKFERTISPSSGYSSQSGTPTFSPKEITPTSPDKHEMKPVKPERSASRASTASPSSSLTSLSSGTFEPVNSDASNSCPSLPPVSTRELTSPLRMEVKELWNVPPPPKVKAPCPPPPETWAQNGRTFTLLCGPSPQISKVFMESTKIEESAVRHEGCQTETGKLFSEKQTEDKAEAPEINSKNEKFICVIPGDGYQVKESTGCPDAEDNTFLAKGKVEITPDVQGEESCSLTKDDSGICEVSTKKEPPPVMKKPQLRENGMLTVRRQSENCNIATTSVNETKDEVDTSEIPSTPANSVHSQNINKSSPPPSPPPTYQPTPPLSRKSPPTSVSTSPVELDREQESRVAESSWPPPPPPLEGDSIFEGGDEIEFPLPPPPDATDNIPSEDSCTTQMDASDTSVPPSEEFVKAIQDSNETETSTPPEPVLHQTVVCDRKDTEASNETTQTISPAFESPSSSTNSPAEIQPPDSGIASSNSFLKRHSLVIESHSTTESPITSQLPTPVTSPLPMENLTAGVAFRRPPSTVHRDTRAKEFLARHKSAPIPKEDANIPLVTPSLLHMVRLRTVSMTEDSVEAPSGDRSTNEGTPVLENCRAPSAGQQNTPPKPTRKSLQSPPRVMKTYVAANTPSIRLQEAIRIKTAALSSREGLPCRLGMRPSYHCASEPGILSLKSSETYDTQRLPVSTASFIFSRSTNRVVIDTGAAPSPEDQAKQSLAAELRRFSDQTNAAASTSGGLRSERVPPPVARKPSQGSVSFSQDHPPRMETNFPAGDGIGAQQHSKGIALPETTTRVTADTIETLF